MIESHLMQQKNEANQTIKGEVQNKFLLYGSLKIAGSINTGIRANYGPDTSLLKKKNASLFDNEHINYRKRLYSFLKSSRVISYQ